ncbi:hypothetical protein Vretimale_17359 [Volvox reticuliferus]|uniref:Uncharacterized protein n=1 Tax=Volvox reticuliferus TaxID=1737510 RepID=A0A8J4BVX8_9CHLO|nr:hypothetical protein Vretifemale_61 [Volvox reticuliferus]GIM14400.1 hypothetical protein Vretimale_17359 [Volvox reticuliferus]
MLKRNRHQSELHEPKEAGLYSRPRVSEAYSDSTCDSDAVEVQRIHSGLPVLPETWKTDVAGIAVEGAACLSGRSVDSDGRNEPDLDFDERAGRLGAPPSCSRDVEALPKCFPQPSTARARNPADQRFHRAYSECAGGQSLHAGLSTAAAVRHKVQRCTTIFAALSKEDLKHQMSLLEGDEKAFLAELRTLRREYGSRVAELQQPSAAARSVSMQVNFQLPNGTQTVTEQPRDHYPVALLHLLQQQRQQGLSDVQPSQDPDPGAFRLRPDAPSPQILRTGPFLASTPGPMSMEANAAAAQPIVNNGGMLKDARQDVHGLMPPPPRPQRLPQTSLTPRYTTVAAHKGQRQERARRQPKTRQLSPSLPAGDAQAGLATAASATRILDDPGAQQRISMVSRVSELLQLELLQQRQLQRPPPPWRPDVRPGGRVGSAAEVQGSAAPNASVLTAGVLKAFLHSASTHAVADKKAATVRATSASAAGGSGGQVASAGGGGLLVQLQLPHPSHQGVLRGNQ